LAYFGQTNAFPFTTTKAPVYITFSNSQDKVFSYRETNTTYVIPQPFVTVGKPYEFSNVVAAPFRAINNLTDSTERRFNDSFKVYRDISNTGRAHPLTGDITRVFDNDAIKKSIENILMTDPMEVPFEPELGIGLRRTMFEINDNITAQELKENILRELQTREPRITLLDASIDFGRGDAISLTLSYIVNAIGDAQNLTLSVKRN